MKHNRPITRSPQIGQGNLVNKQLIWDFTERLVQQIIQYSFQKTS